MDKEETLRHLVKEDLEKCEKIKKILVELHFSLAACRPELEIEIHRLKAQLLEFRIKLLKMM